MVTKVLPPVNNPMTIPGVIANDERDAQQKAYDANNLGAQNWINWFNSTWLAQYYQGSVIPYDANPTLPPVSQWVVVSEENLPNGAVSFSYTLIDSPMGDRVCQAPAFNRLPPPNVPHSLMQQLVDEGRVQAITVPASEVSKIVTASNGSTYMRLT